MTVETASFESLLSPVVVKCPDITPGSEISNATVKTVETDEGWKNIHVFYGDPKHIKKTDRLAQLKQDEIVAALTRHATGLYFVDLAAHEAMYISNTYRLERDWNWNGLCIEANPEYWRDLTYRRCEVVAAVIGAEKMEEVNFQTTRDGALGGIEHKDFKNKPHHAQQKAPTPYYTVPFRDVLDRMQAPKVMDYLSLDVEGAEFFVMQNFPFDQYSFRILTVEGVNEQLKILLESHGYEKACQLGVKEEQLWVLTSEKSQLDFTASILPPLCRSEQ
eukprot:CAMPEP_0119016280 /NCGR_PEP_ID=MMETSP1176-20130426/11912_1 /TAXON_ID=265551 /ORGANISM="Synedropsis recta cf, Strain CCMP1620" /LENGTH=275 /DNA_ID=CAMNT_0006969623 /DNA_START=168 /DNA_END=995 /DNA_ORIENTATION=+